METRINPKIGGISKALYISEGKSEIYYNAGKAGVDYRFLEYGASYLVSDSSDFNILENMTNDKISDFFGTEDFPASDALENLYNTAIPCDIGDGTGDYNKYFGSFIVDQKSIYVFLVPEGVEKIKLFQDILRDPYLLPGNEEEFNDPSLDCDLLIDFQTGKETTEAKVVYIAITQANRDTNREVKVGLKAWLQLINPVRHKPASLLSIPDTRVKVERAAKKGNIWYDAASGVILGNHEVRGSILKRKKASIPNFDYSPWKSYSVGEKAVYPEADRINLRGVNHSDTFILPAGEIVLYGDCTVSDILVDSRSIWFSGVSELTQTEEGKLTHYVSSPGSSLIYRTTRDENTVISPISLSRIDKNYECLRFTLLSQSEVRIDYQHDNRVGGGCLVIESPKTWISLRDNNIGNPPTGISPFWSTNENLTNYYTQITEICCDGGDLIPSGLVNIKSDTTKIGAKLVLKPGWKAAEQEDGGIEITQRLDPSENTYFYVSISKEYNGYWKRKYNVSVVPDTPEIYFQFPILLTNSNSGYSLSSPINITEFYDTPGNINKGVRIDIKGKIAELSTEYQESVQPIMEFLATQEYEISPEFPGMTIDDSGIATVSSVSVYSGTYQFLPKNRRYTVLMANSYDFSVSNPYDYVDYGSIIDGLSFRSETGAVPGWIWIDKAFDLNIPEDEDQRIKFPLSDLVSGQSNAIIIDGRDYGFTRMIITKSGEEYRIKIEDIKNSIKIDIIEA